MNRVDLSIKFSFNATAIDFYQYKAMSLPSRAGKNTFVWHPTKNEFKWINKVTFGSLKLNLGFTFYYFGYGSVKLSTKSRRIACKRTCIFPIRWITDLKKKNDDWSGFRVYNCPAAFKSARSLTTCSGIGGGVGKWSPLAWKPFSSATQVMV